MSFKKPEKKVKEIVTQTTGPAGHIWAAIKGPFHDALKESFGKGYTLGLLHAAEHMFRVGMDTYAAEIIDDFAFVSIAELKRIAKLENINIKWEELKKK